jgi:hypothetical protein
MYGKSCLCLAMSGFLPVTPTIHPAKPENAVDQQLLGCFRSSFEELKPYPYAPRLSFSTIPNFIFFVLKLPTFFRELPLVQTSDVQILILAKTKS